MTPQSRGKKSVAALWAFDRTDRYPPQFVGAISESLVDHWSEETERILNLARRWFSDFDDEPEVEDRWTFAIHYHEVEIPTVLDGERV
jgi:hypothetical protein